MRIPAIILVLACTTVAAQQASTEQAPKAHATSRAAIAVLGRSETPHVVVTTSTRPAATPGKVTLVVRVEPKARMHVYAPGQTDYIPVTLKLRDDPAVTAQPARFPPAEKRYFTPLDETQFVYSKPFEILEDVLVRAPGHTQPELTVRGVLNYQACDDAICYMPVDVPLSWTVPLRPR